MLSTEQIQTVKSTLPLLESAGVQITQHFYQRMFTHNPELKDIFNLSHQQTGGQPVALFNAIAAYVKHLDNLPVLSDLVERIAHKHTSFNIQEAHYPIVGHHLIETLRELAGDAFSPEVEGAWTAAYQFLASIFIGREQQLYQANAQQTGGWRGARAFRVRHKKPESQWVCSFVLEPVDGQAVSDYHAGQYLGIQVKPTGHAYTEIRQYSLSDKANGRDYRISVKRESSGVVSNYLHDVVQEGDILNIFPPAGDFKFIDRQAPVVLISAGVGVTPMQAILETLAAQSYAHGISYIHACDNSAAHSFSERVAALGAVLPLKSYTWYRHEALNAPNTYQGLMVLSEIAEQLPLLTGDFYLCGPVAFMRFAKQQLLALGVRAGRIHYEVFGPHQSL